MSRNARLLCVAFLLPFVSCKQQLGRGEGGGCEAGYEQQQGACVDVDECANGTSNCHADAACANTDGGYTCTCQLGFSGDGTTCTDIDECADDPCDALVACNNTAGGFECGACPDGYDDVNGDGTLCEVLPSCATDNGGCHVEATCTDTADGPSCACNAGFDGNGITCIDVDECAVDPCDALVSCTNTDGGYECGVCPTGYDGNGTTCADIDECLTDNGGCAADADCLNEAGGRSCACQEGYSGDGLVCTQDANDTPPEGTVLVRGTIVMLVPKTGHQPSDVPTVTDVLFLKTSDDVASQPDGNPVPSENQLGVIAQVSPAGEFNATLTPGNYDMSAADRNKTGQEMEVARFSLGGNVDVLSVSESTAPNVDFGVVSVDVASKTAMVEGATEEDASVQVLDQIGMNLETALWLGNIDDQTMSCTNIDIDGNGVYDLEQNGTHYRFDPQISVEFSVDGAPANIGSITNVFLDENKTALVFTKASLYLIYDDDNVSWVNNGVLQGGASVVATEGNQTRAPSGYSAAPYMGKAQWGPDYNASVEMPGSGEPGTLTFTFGGRTLTFNVKMPTHADLSDAYALQPFLMVNTDTLSGKITDINYEWRRRKDATWVVATDKELEYVLGKKGGGYAGFVINGGQVGTRIPREASGKIAWTADAFEGNTTVLVDATPADICGVTLSYANTLCLRWFTRIDGAPGACGE